MPGGIDVHTHLDMPFGGTTSADDFESGTIAAAHGGTTSLVDFAIQYRGQTMRHALDDWRGKADGKAAIDYGFHMIVTELPDAGLDEMDRLVRDEGITSFKLFMAYPGVFMVDDATIFRALQRTGANGGLVCMHAENGGVIDELVKEALRKGQTAPKYHALTRPSRAEGEATGRAIALAEMAGVPIYIVHLSAADALEKVKQARDMGLPAYAETCPQYLFLSYDNYEEPGFDGAKYVMSPPLREKWHQDVLWKGLAKNDLQVISTDHCPFCMAEQKTLGKDDFSKIPNGAPGIETRLTLVHNGGVRQRPHEPEPLRRAVLDDAGEDVRPVPAQGDDRRRQRRRHRAVRSEPEADARRQDAAHEGGLQPVRRDDGPRIAVHRHREREGHHRGRDVRREERRWPIPEARAVARIFPVTTTQVERADGRVELTDTRRIEASPLYNHDLAPVPIARRTWTTYNYAALWISMAHCIPTYMLASALMAAGMNWWQALVTILLGNTIVLVPILLNSHPGTKYGIPFPVFARAAYGTIGSNLPALLRALVACGWFGIQAWIGGEALHTFFASVIPGWPTLLGAGVGGHTTTEWLSFLLFWSLNIYIIYRGMDLLRMVENWAAPFVLVMTAALLAWAIWRADGLGPLLAEPGKFTTFREFFPVFIPSLTAMIGFWATLSLNMPDFTRFGRSQREQVVGQVVALPTTMFVFAAMGVLITSATTIIYGEMIWDPIKLIGRFSSPVVVAISMFTAVVATLSVNIAANVVSPANDFANAFPRLISFRTGGLITGLLGIAIQPWKLLDDPSGYIFTGGCSAIRAASDRSPACSSRTTGSSGGARSRSRTSTSRTARTATPAGGTCRQPSPRWPAARSPGEASSSTRCGRSTTMRGSWGSRSLESCTWVCHDVPRIERDANLEATFKQARHLGSSSFVHRERVETHEWCGGSPADTDTVESTPERFGRAPRTRHAPLDDP